MAKSKFFRVAVEGATVDGRVIQREWLEQCAAGYNPATYAARINCEHIAGYSPDKPFNAYGTVASLKTEEVTLSINGENKVLLGLYAEIEANDQLVAINKAGQKLFTSCEIHPDFAGEGKAYLVGLAVTDQPASLGTEPLKFAAQSRPNLFTSAHETQIDILSAPIDGDAIGKSIGESIMAFFKKKEEPAAPPPPEEGPVLDQQWIEEQTGRRGSGDTGAQPKTIMAPKTAPPSPASSRPGHRFIGGLARKLATTVSAGLR